MEQTGMKKSKTNLPLAEHWTSFYAKNSFKEYRPSQFAMDCSKLIKPNSKIIELGCGNCRDSLFFASTDGGSNKIISVDMYASPPEEIQKDIFFIKSDVGNLPDIKCDYIYSRFFLHAINEEKEDFLLNYIKRNCNQFFIECRSDKSYFDGDHYRRFINKEKIEKKLNQFNFKYDLIEDKDLAKYKDENPIVIRIFGKNI